LEERRGDSEGISAAETQRLREILAAEALRRRREISAAEARRLREILAAEGRRDSERNISHRDAEIRMRNTDIGDTQKRKGVIISTVNYFFDYGS
jgi:hypothetical protein